MTEMSLKATTKNRSKLRSCFLQKKVSTFFSFQTDMEDDCCCYWYAFLPAPTPTPLCIFDRSLCASVRLLLLFFVCFIFFIIVVSAATGWLSPCWNNKRRYGTRYLSLFVANHWSNAVAVDAALVTATRHRYRRALHWHQCMPVHRLRTTGCCVAWWMLATSSFRLPDWLTDWLADIEKNFNNNHYNWTRQWKIQLVAVCV